MYDQPGSHVPRNRAAVEARREKIKQTYDRLGSIAATAAELRIWRNTVKYALNPNFAERKRRANLARYHVNTSISR